MSDAVNHEKGFSLPETLLAMTLLVMVVTALGGFQRWAGNGFYPVKSISPAVARRVARYGQMNPRRFHPARSVTLLQTSAARCVSITVTITMPVDKRNR